jgi:hypothetical protein
MSEPSSSLRFLAVLSLAFPLSAHGFNAERTVTRILEDYPLYFSDKGAEYNVKLHVAVIIALYHRQAPALEELVRDDRFDPTFRLTVWESILGSRMGGKIAECKHGNGFHVDRIEMPCNGHTVITHVFFPWLEGFEGQQHLLANNRRIVVKPELEPQMGKPVMAYVLWSGDE